MELNGHDISKKVCIGKEIGIDRRIFVSFPMGVFLLFRFEVGVSPVTDGVGTAYEQYHDFAGFDCSERGWELESE